jgi:hypothetical protein
MKRFRRKVFSKVFLNLIVIMSISGILVFSGVASSSTTVGFAHWGNYHDQAGYGGYGPPPPAAGGAPTLSSTLFGTTGTTIISGTGIIQRTIEATTADGKLTATFPRGTRALDKNGNALSSLMAAVDANPPPAPAKTNIIGLAYNFGPAGATFDPGITFTWRYDPETLPQGVAEKDLVLAYYDTAAGKWVELECVVDTENNKITATVTHFTTFAILATIPPKPAAFKVSGLAISPSEVYPGESVTVSVLVSNSGEVSGSYRVTFKVNDVVVATKDTTVAAGASQTVSFTTSQSAAGTYTVNIDGLSGSFAVKKAVVPPKPAAFKVSGLAISPSEVYPGESVTVSVLVSNSGEVSGSYRVTFKVNDVVVATKDTTVAAGASQTVTFVTSQIAGTYAVDVDGLSGTFTVKTPVTPPPEKPVVPAKPTNWPLIGGVIAIVIVIAGSLTYFGWWRRRKA